MIFYPESCVKTISMILGVQYKTYWTLGRKGPFIDFKKSIYVIILTYHLVTLRLYALKKLINAEFCFLFVPKQNA